MYSNADQTCNRVDRKKFNIESDCAKSINWLYLQYKQPRSEEWIVKKCALSNSSKDKENIKKSFCILKYILDYFRPESWMAECLCKKNLLIIKFILMLILKNLSGVCTNILNNKVMLKIEEWIKWY